MSEAQHEINFDFVYNAVGFHEDELFGLKDWILNPDFQQKVAVMVCNGKWPDGKDLIQIMKDVYTLYDLDRKAHKDFNFRAARTVIKTLSQKHGQ